jgi:putative component of membrane protein insertase Oxa1/YidC/SpoIIIJ protein YidD
MKNNLPALWLVLLLNFSLAPDLLSAQNSNLEGVNNLVRNELMSNCGASKTTNKDFLQLHNKHSRKNPLIYLAGALLFVYQNVISEQISANCNYEISCSEYTKRSISEYGLFRGTIYGLHQLSCCAPNMYKDYCEYQISSNGKIDNVVVK